LSTPPSFDRTVAVWRYDPPCDRLIHSLKYRARLPLAHFFAAALAAQIRGPVDLAVAVPLHRQRLAERGFNHAVEIARSLSRQLHIPLALSGVTRLRHTAPQMQLPYPERAANIRGAFACALDLRGRRVAVVDDVMTTGATLNELARVLKRAGAEKVENWIVARTLLD
jgi:ComF family protein